MENATWEEGKRHGASQARPLPSPKGMSAAQRRIDDLTMDGALKPDDLTIND